VCGARAKCRSTHPVRVTLIVTGCCTRNRGDGRGERRLRGTRYIALVDGSAGKYGVIVPDLPGCTSGGKALDEALHNAVEAVRLWAEDAIADGEALPPPRSLEDIRSDRKVVRAVAEGAALAVVPLVIDSGRLARANLSIDEWMLTAIDEAARARGLTRSAFLVSAAREKIEGDT
jgi:predicted RNase H-like HicB family nuclease